MTVTGQQACFPYLVCSNGCCGRFQISFRNQSSSLIVCNNSVRMAFHPNFYLLCVVCLQRPHEGNVHKLQFMSAMRGKDNSVHPVLPNTFYHLDIPRMRIGINQCQGSGIFFRWLNKTDKMFEPLRKALFLDLPSLVTSCYLTWYRAIQEFSLHVFPGKHQKRKNMRARGVHVGHE